MDWSSWRRHFEHNRTRPLPSLDGELGVPERVRAPLLASLVTFQRGETGEGRIAHEIDRARLPGIDDDYRAALKLFVAEEGRHARILGDLVRALGGRTAPAPVWTERLFVHGRRLLGVRHKLVVLLAAEVIAVGFYGLLAERLPEGDVRRALEQIVDDERHHFDFHVRFFRAQHTHGGFPFRALWWAVASTAMAVVLLDHRATLRAFEIPEREAAARLFSLVARADAEVTTACRGALSDDGAPSKARLRAGAAA